MQTVTLNHGGLTTSRLGMILVAVVTEFDTGLLLATAQPKKIIRLYFVRGLQKVEGMQHRPRYPCF